jgi:entericidin B
MRPDRVRHSLVTTVNFRSARFVLLAVLTTCLGLSGCNTVKGLGQDIQKAGQVIEGAGKK